MACPCGLEVEQPWRTRNNPWSPASIVGGVVLVAFGVWVVAIGMRAWVGWLVLGVIGAAIVVAWVVQGVRGHRGWCLVGRGAWFGMATPGAPLRLLF